MYLVLQRAAERRGRKLHLILPGKFDDDVSRIIFTPVAKRACPDVTVHYVDGHDAEIHAKAWAAADVSPFRRITYRNLRPCSGRGHGGRSSRGGDRLGWLSRYR